MYLRKKTHTILAIVSKLRLRELWLSVLFMKLNGQSVHSMQETIFVLLFNEAINSPISNIRRVFHKN